MPKADDPTLPRTKPAFYTFFNFDNRFLHPFYC